jgi:hypothetical protein
MRRILLAMAVAALMAVMAASAAAAQEGPPDQAQGPPVGGCPASYEPGLVPVEVVLEGAGLEEPDPSMDPNGDGYTCLKILHTGSGTRATWHDNVTPL